MAEELEEQPIFWKEGFDGKAIGGWYFRSFELNKFIKGLEAQQDSECVGVQFEGNNINIILKVKDDG